MQTSKALRKRIRLGIDQKINAALAIERHCLVAMLGNRPKTHTLKQSAHRLRIGRGIFNELKACCAHGVIPSCFLHDLLS